MATLITIHWIKDRLKTKIVNKICQSNYKEEDINLKEDHSKIIVYSNNNNKMDWILVHQLWVKMFTIKITSNIIRSIK
jgi:hypothetical protein